MSDCKNWGVDDAEPAELPLGSLFDVAEIQRINLGPNDTLSVKLLGNDFTEASVNHLSKELKKIFKKNRVMVFAIPEGNDILFEAVTEPEANYCSDCSCGKKERVEETNEHHS